MDKFLSRGFVNFGAGFFIFLWHWAVIRSMRHRGHRKPLTPGGLPSLGTGVFKKLTCFSECLFFLYISFGVQCTGCHCLSVSASPRSPWTDLGGACSRPVHCRHSEASACTL